MFLYKTFLLTLGIVFCSSFTMFGQWSVVDSGTTNNLNGAHLLDSETGFVVGDAGAILKTTDAGATLFFDQPIEAIDFPQATSGFAVGWGGRILHSADMGITWMDQSSGTSANLSDVNFASDGFKRHCSW